jgi:hypothetical protein
MNLSFLLPKVRRDFAAAEARAARGDWIGTTKDTTPARQRIVQGEVECVGWEPTGAKRSDQHENLTTEDTDGHKQAAGLRLAGQAGAYEPDSLASKLADSPAPESLNRSASIPVSSPATSHSPRAT